MLKENKLTVRIKKLPKDVFEFTINPKNTPKWLEMIKSEETNEWPIKVGTKYRNKRKDGEWTEYIVTVLESNKLFEIKSADGNYHTRYTYKRFEDGTELEYYEWVDKGEIDSPFMIDILDKLKKLSSCNGTFQAQSSF
ncbi:MAG: SRPBCC family protein [Patescibacteria group bacterium]|jgi:uncharacterized protein YndB with AHSA1/START domain